MSELAIAGVSKTLGGFLALENIDLAVATGSRTAIVGASGSGKSTLLRLIAGFDRPDAGTITIGGTVVSDADRFTPAHRRGIGFVAQDGALFPHLTARQNIHFGLRRSVGRTDRVREVAELAGLDAAMLGRYPHELSGGQQQRVALARALAPRPAVVLLDEPFSALDTGLRNSTRTAVIAALEASAVTTILVTHDQREALSFGDQIAVISHGRIVQVGTPTAVFAAPADRGTAEFLGDALFIPVRIEGGTVRSPLGKLHASNTAEIRGAEGSALALVRPGQLTVTSHRDGHNAIVRFAKAVGSTLELTLTLTDWPLSVEAQVTWPLANAPLLVSGQSVTLQIIGDVVVYPTP